MFLLEEYQKNLQEAYTFLQKVLPCLPELAVVAGTGLGEMIPDLEIDVALEYTEIPHFPRSTIQSHCGRLLVGKVNSRLVALFQGRFHLYEGYEPWEIVFPLRVLHLCGVNSLIVTNAAGGLNPDFKVGNLMLLNDHINLTGVNPLRGPHDVNWGPRFPDMSAIYDRTLMQLAREKAKELDIPIQEGVYVGVSGPSLESPAETRFFRNSGADAIGMSTVLEVIAAVQAGMKILGLSVITNVNNPDAMQSTSLKNVIDAGQQAAPRLASFISAVISDWPYQQNGCM